MASLGKWNIIGCTNSVGDEMESTIKTVQTNQRLIDHRRNYDKNECNFSRYEGRSPLYYKIKYGYAEEFDSSRTGGIELTGFSRIIEYVGEGRTNV